MLAVGAALAASGCASTKQVEAARETNERIYDPLEPVNRQMFRVHTVLDTVVLEPLAKGYRAVTPKQARTSVRNFLNNAASPAVFINNVLQGDIEGAGVTLARFGINTTFGILGLFDPAAEEGLELRWEDFGQTLAVWGVDNGPFLYVPVLGPTTTRDMVGRGVDSFASPYRFVEFDNEDSWRTGQAILNGIDQRAALIEPLDELERTALDLYAAQRSFYYSLRDDQTANGEQDFEDLPEFD